MKSKPASEVPMTRIGPAPVVGMPLPELIAREQKRQRRRAERRAALRPAQRDSGGNPRRGLLAGDHLQRVAVQPGLSDGELTAVTSLALEVGARVIVDLTPEGERAYDLTLPKD